MYRRDATARSAGIIKLLFPNTFCCFFVWLMLFYSRKLFFCNHFVMHSQIVIDNGKRKEKNKTQLLNNFLCMGMLGVLIVYDSELRNNTCCERGFFFFVFFFLMAK